MKKVIICLIATAFSAGCVNAQVKKAPVKTVPAPSSSTTMNATTAAKPVMKTLLDSFSYAAGVNIANGMRQQGIDNINVALLSRAIDDIYKNNPPAIPLDQCNMKLQEQMQIVGKKKEAENKIKEAEGKKLADAEKVKGDAFLATNKLRKEITTLPDGLQYEILKAGDAAGLKPTALDTVVVDYAGTLIDGKPFDASKPGSPVTFPVGGVIKGWTEILQLMTKGAHWKVYIPSDLAYGSRGAGGAIPGGSTLIFEITLEDIKPAATK